MSAQKKDGTEPGAEKPDVLTVDSFDRPILDSLPAAKAGGRINSREVDPVHWTRVTSPSYEKLSVAGVHRDGLIKIGDFVAS